MIIYALVEATTKDEALAEGKLVFDALVGALPESCLEFDYYVTFDEENTEVAGEARWGERPAAAPIDSEKGQALLERGWTKTKENFESQLKEAKEALNEYSAEEIRRNKNQSRNTFYQVGAYKGPPIYLYSQHLGGIRDREQLDYHLEQSDNLWIVPAGVHY